MTVKKVAFGDLKMKGRRKWGAAGGAGSRPESHYVWEERGWMAATLMLLLCLDQVMGDCGLTEWKGWERNGWEEEGGVLAPQLSLPVGGDELKGGVGGGGGMREKEAEQTQTVCLDLKGKEGRERGDPGCV